MRRVAVPVSRLAGVLVLLAAACSAPPAIVLEDATGASGLPALAQRCLAVSDFDGDGAPDVLLAEADANGQFTGELGLYRNRGDATFTRTAVRLPLTRIVQCREGDFDRDGQTDLAVVGSGPGLPTDPAVLLLRGDSATFTPVFPDLTRLVAGVPNSVAFAELDGDGFPELVVGTYSANEVRFGPCVTTDDDLQCPPVTPPSMDPPTVLKNLSGQGFARAEQQPATGSLALYLDPVDFDGDGRMDLFVSNDGPSQLYRNTPDGFVDVLPGWKANPYSHAMGAAFADYDRDGRLDVLVADAGPYQLWFGTAGGLESRASAWGLTELTRHRLGWSPVAADFDRDGFTDVFVVNVGTLDNGPDTEAVLKHQAVSRVVPQADFILRNAGGRSFEAIEVPHATRLPSISDAFTRVADFDRDGWPDVVVVIAPDTPEVRLLLNRTKDR